MPLGNCHHGSGRVDLPDISHNNTVQYWYSMIYALQYHTVLYRYHTVLYRMIDALRYNTVQYSTDTGTVQYSIYVVSTVSLSIFKGRVQYHWYDTVV